MRAFILVTEKIGGTQKMSEYIFGHRNGIHIIDLQKTVVFFNQALEVIKNYASQGKNILFIGTKRQASEIIERYALECNQFFINKRWLWRYVDITGINSKFNKKTKKKLRIYLKIK